MKASGELETINANVPVARSELHSWDIGNTPKKREHSLELR